MVYTFKDLILVLIMNYMFLMMASHSSFKSYSVNISRRISVYLFLNRKMKKVSYPAFLIGLWVVPSSVIFTFIFIIEKAFSIEELDSFLPNFNSISVLILGIAGILTLVLTLIEER